MKSKCIITLIIFILTGCQSVPQGGVVPTISEKKYDLNILSITWSDLSLTPGHRRIPETGFVVTNPDDKFIDNGVYGGILGVLIADKLNEQKLKGNLEDQFKEQLDLAQITYSSFANNHYLVSEIATININSNISDAVISIDPWCLVSTYKRGYHLTPQLKATLRNKGGKLIWQNNYAPLTSIEHLISDSSMTVEYLQMIKDSLSNAYYEIGSRLYSDISGQDIPSNDDEVRDISSDLMRNLDKQLEKNLTEDKNQ